MPRRQPVPPPAQTDPARPALQEQTATPARRALRAAPKLKAKIKAATAPPADPPRAALHVPLAAALQGSEELGSLLQRLRQSRQRFEVLCPLLPPSLRAMLQPGPIDEKGWSLLVANAAAAAKLRHMLPELADALRAHGWPDVPIRLKVQARQAL